MIEARTLKAGMAFKKRGQKKWRIAAKVYPLESHLTNDGSPGVLVCLHDCSQVVLSETELIETPDEPHVLDRDGFAKLGRRRAAEKLRRRSGKVS